MLANVTELPRSWRHPQSTLCDDPILAAAAATRFTLRLVVASKATLIILLAIFSWYVNAFLGWGFLVAILSNELTTFFANITLPFFCIWFGLIYIDNRGHSAVSRLRKSQAKIAKAEAEANSIERKVVDSFLQNGQVIGNPFSNRPWTCAGSTA